MTADYSFGIEEEYFIADAVTRGTRRRVSKRFFAACRKAFPDEVQPEMLQSQIEIATRPMSDFSEARAVLARLRGGLAGIAREHGLLLVAAATHPTAVWSEQSITRKARYAKLRRDLQMIGSRNLICGMHVHVGVSDPDRRVDLMNRMTHFLPLLLALSTSSPFWQTRLTGLMSYRIATNREMPRSGLPEFFATTVDYERYVDILVAAGAIDNASFVWWLVRPSLHHPTLELRVADIATRLDDAIAIAALYRALVRHLDRNPAVAAEAGGVMRGIVAENIWRAQRYGVGGSFVDAPTRAAKSVADTLDETIALVAEDAAALGCAREVEAARDIVARGTSADGQLAVYRDAINRGLDRRSALVEVVDWLAAETAGGHVPRAGAEPE